jgi:arylsulfatase A-like enzyme
LDNKVLSGALLGLVCLAACTQINFGGTSRSDISVNPDGTSEVTPPNVIVIVADQMRRASMGFWAQEKYQGLLNGNSDYVVTPTLDQLADQSAVFTQAIANFPLCSPFRGMLMSGKYPNNNGVTNNTRAGRPEVGLREDITTLTESLYEAGYNTALVGKGHWKVNLPLFDKNSVYVGSERPPGGHYMRGTKFDTYIPPGPSRNSIEYWYQTLGHNHDSPTVYTNDIFISNKPEGHPFYPKVYSAVDQANVIIDYIENNRNQRNGNKPFSLLWTMDPPHSPYQEIEDTDEAIYKAYYEDVPMQTILNRPNVNMEKGQLYAKYHFSMVTLLDREIGRVVDTLKAQGILDNTLIVFTADHGEMMASHDKMAKNNYFEESLSIPLMVYYPGKVEHYIDDLLISVPDFMPTILGLLGLEQYIPEDLDGTDFSQHIVGAGQSGVAKPKSSLYYGKSGELGLRTHTYTFSLNKDADLIALYNNINDPYQMDMLSFDDIPAEDVVMLKSELGYWLARINHPWYQQKSHTHAINYPL